MAENIQDIARVALRAVGNINLIRVHLDTAGLVRHLGDGLAQPSVTLLRAVAVESLALRLIVDSLVHCVDGCPGQGLGDIADAAANDVGSLIRMSRGKSRDAATDFREEVTGLKLQKVIIDLCHAAYDARMILVWQAQMRHSRALSP